MFSKTKVCALLGWISIQEYEHQWASIAAKLGFLIALVFVQLRYEREKEKRKKERERKDRRSALLKDKR